MVSLFDMLPIYIGAALAGVVWAMQTNSGTAWKLISSIAMALLAWKISRLLFIGLGHMHDAKFKKKLKRLPIEDLEKQLKDPNCIHMDLILLEIKNRGMNLAQYHPFLVGRLGDANGSHRLFAFKAFRAVFPDELERIRGYTPYENAEKCRAKTVRLLET